MQSTRELAAQTLTRRRLPRPTSTMDEAEYEDAVAQRIVAMDCDTPEKEARTLEVLAAHPPAERLERVKRLLAARR